MEINPCPYCHGTETDIVYGSWSCAVHCLRCNRYGPARHDITESIEEWNKITGVYDTTKQVKLEWK